MMKENGLLISEMLRERPYVIDFFKFNGLKLVDEAITIEAFIERQPYSLFEDMGLDKKRLIRDYYAFIERMEAIRCGALLPVDSMTVMGGWDKDKVPESGRLVMKKGEIIGIVGPTGSGKSRLLADIEWLARGDTPTGRRVLINGEIPPENWRTSSAHRLVAQISQNMNFVMDLSVQEFLRLHAESRLIDNPDEKIAAILNEANHLSGEAFDPSTPLTALSGGQSRALMIADAALLCISPIVLIDEIENAGIDKVKALKLLASRDKIVLIATHDPLLALNADQRIVIKNGGICKTIWTSSEEKGICSELKQLDDRLSQCREQLRKGQKITFN